ncbi:TetR/AcrR family transcriptional regulator [Natronorubrum texcoconense]|uniref:DNA-binding transcriptional regulator, AcrR family n=1 Tax=Natronorubrum texcoconense TaxID=1095776 RepID=A0A1G9BB00_9EURY|nr:TetR/AcrR family transcriptional regulator [Natronorubrum texcoconense]SDK36065.1 DNA-binding transcriptional regulator, AcrR family [Natronorubrum texcoconense]
MGRRDGTDDTDPHDSEIVWAVMQALAKHGYADLTTKKIAAEYSRGESALYYHYDSKDDLICAFLDSSLDWFDQELDAIDAADPDERLFEACEILIGNVLDPDDGGEYAGLYIALAELSAHAPYNETFRERLVKQQRSVIEKLAAILDDGIEDGTFRPVDPEATAAFLVVTCDSIIDHAVLLGMDDVASMIRAQLFAFVRSNLLAADGPDELR